MKRLLLLLFFCPFLSVAQYDVDISKKSPSPKEIVIKKAEEDKLNWGCQFIPYHEYKAGMKFYFPKNKYADPEWDMNYYVFPKSKQKGKRPIYEVDKSPKVKDLSGKIFVITSVEIRKNDLGDKTFYILKEENGDMIIEHGISPEIEFIKKRYEETGAQTFTMRGAVYLADIDAFKAKYLGAELFTKFYIDSLKFQKVKVVEVGAGTDKAPVRIIAENDKGNKAQIDVVTCGTNVEGSYLDDFFYSFQFSDPKSDYKGQNWEAICSGKIFIGMPVADLLLSWGKPKKINETTTSGLKSSQYVYDSQYVYVDNGKVTSFQSSK